MKDKILFLVKGFQFLSLVMVAEIWTGVISKSIYEMGFSNLL